MSRSPQALQPGAEGAARLSETMQGPRRRMQALRARPEKTERTTVEGPERATARAALRMRALRMRALAAQVRETTWAERAAEGQPAQVQAAEGQPAQVQAAEVQPVRPRARRTRRGPRAIRTMA